MLGDYVTRGSGITGIGNGRISPSLGAYSVGGTAVVLYIACAILYSVSPNGMRVLFQSIVHSAAVQPLPITATSFIVGLVGIGIIGAVTGLVFAVIYNHCLKMR